MKEWYLVDNYKPTATSGYESDAISEFSQSNFADVLETTFSDTVLLYNNTLSESKEIRCLIQGNSADTQLKSMERTGLFPIGTVKAGMYIFFENRYWLITGYPSNNKSYEKAVMQLCQYKIRWQNAKGEIIERWINATSASKYDVGENGNNRIILTSDNLTLLFPNDEESLNIDGKRVFIDKRVPPKKVYKITRSDDILYDFGEHGGVLSFIADKNELDVNNDNSELGICNYKPILNENGEEGLWFMRLESPTRTIKPTNEDYMISACLYDNNGEIVEDAEYVWNVVSNIGEDLVYKSNNNILTMSLSSKNEMYGEIIIVSCMSKHTGHTNQIEFVVQEVW